MNGRVLRVMALAAAVLATGARTAHGQIARGVVTESDGVTPVAGAVVVLLDDKNAVAGTSLADEKGVWQVTATAGRYRVRVDRVGFQSTMSPAFELKTGLTVSQKLTLRDVVQSIRDVQVSEKARCVVGPDSAAALAAVWEEARKGLTAIALTERSRRLLTTVATYERSYDPSGKRLVDQKTGTDSGLAARPWTVAPPEKLATIGYAEAKGEYVTFYGPDAGVLLSNEFLSGHCVKLRAAVPNDSLPNRIGIAFVPADAKKKITDIEGTLWLDRTTGDVLSLDFKYTRMPGGIDHESTGGHMEFRRLPTGAWVIQRWSIRMPQAGTESRTVSSVNANSNERSQRFDERLVPILAGIKEVGGEVMKVVIGPGKIWSNDGARLTGTVFDSTTGKPLEGAAVFLQGTAYFALSRPDGTFRLTDLPAGPYVVSLRHPRLDSLALAAPTTTVTLARGGSAETQLAIPSSASQLVAQCGDSVPATQRTLVRGQVRDRDTGAPVSGAEIQIAGTGQPSGGTSVTTAAGAGKADTRGFFQLCGTPSGATLKLTAVGADGRKSERTVTAEAGRIVVALFTLGEN